MQTNTHKLVTIGLPIYKRLEYLDHVLESVAAQDYPNIELLVSDNGMNGDRIREIVGKHYPRPFVIRRNPSSVPIGRHFTQLVEEARGDYFVLLCDDDEISPNYVSELAASLDSHPEATVAISRQELMEVDGTVVRSSKLEMPPVLTGDEFIAATWRDYAYGMEGLVTVMARTSRLRECGGYPDFCRGTNIDNAAIVRMIVGNSVALNARCVFRWRLDDASYGWSVSYKELALACKEFLDFLDHDPIIREYAERSPDLWRPSREHLVRMTWKTYLGRWREIYKSRLSRTQWLRAAFALPLISDYYRGVARHLYHDAKDCVKRRIHPFLPIKTLRLP